MPEAKEVEVSVVSLMQWLKQDGSGWAIVGLLLYMGPLAMERMDASDARNVQAWKDAQKSHELFVERQTTAYQKSIDDLVEQWKDDRRMLIDVLQGRRIEPAKQPINGGAMVMPEQHGQGNVESALTGWRKIIRAEESATN